jgi:hypothetical protein
MENKLTRNKYNNNIPLYILKFLLYILTIINLLIICIYRRYKVKFRTDLKLSSLLF